jgi:hypothetical protein
MVLLPYQVSFMLFFELYQMAVPLFLPSPALLAQWHLQHGVLSERSWNLVFGHPSNSSVLPQHAHYASSAHALSGDPNNEQDLAAVQEWIALADFYQLPHVLYFTSFKDLLEQLSDPHLSKRLQETSERMLRHNEVRGREVTARWEDVVGRVRARKKELLATAGSSGVVIRGHGAATKGFNEALDENYGVRLPPSSCEG